MNVWLVAALAAPVVGAGFYLVFHTHPRTIRMMDRVVLVALPVLILLQVLPHMLTENEPLLLVWLAVGAVFLNLLEKTSQLFAKHTDNVTIFIGTGLIAVHAFLEGGALLPGQGGDTAFLIAVVLHRVPVGLLVWWLLEPRHGATLAALGVGSIVTATLVGYLLGVEMLPGHHETMERYQAFVAGSLLHVVFHQGMRDHRHA